MFGKSTITNINGTLADSTNRRVDERASVLMLVPAGLLVLILLAAIAVDSSIAFMARRELDNVAASAANDAVTRAISEQALQQQRPGDISTVAPTESAVRAAVEQAFASHEWNGVAAQLEEVSLNAAGDTVTVTSRAEAPYIFSSAIPGVSDHAVVRSQVSAQLRFRAAD